MLLNKTFTIYRWKHTCLYGTSSGSGSSHDNFMDIIKGLIDDTPAVKTTDSKMHLIDKLQSTSTQSQNQVAQENFSKLAELFSRGEANKARLKNRKTVKELKHFAVYPKQIKKWVTFTRTPRGFYDQNGRWLGIGEHNQNDWSLEQDEALKISRNKMEKVFEEEQQKLPGFLRGRFRFGVQYNEIKDLGPKVRRLFSFSHATAKEIRKEQKNQAIQKWRKHEFDTASDAIQVDVLTLRIRALIDHLKKKTNKTLTMEEIYRFLSKGEED